jgi:lipoprotein-anchoring transpeptidase ErfK/SrfK
MRLPNAICVFLLALAASLSANAKVVVGPVPEEKAQPAPAKSSTAKPSEERGRIFERVGIKVIRKGIAAPDAANAEALLEGIMQEGTFSREELIQKVRDESPVVVTHMVVDISRQRLFVMNRDSQVLAEYKVSTGRPGYETPPGNYTIVNKAAYAYSKKYEADMFHWMGLTSNGDIGMHGLKGGGYERILGRRASHGCIRLSRADAKYLFSIIPVGMKVQVTSALDKVVYYKPIKEEDLMKLIDGLISRDYQTFAQF